MIINLTRLRDPARLAALHMLSLIERQPDPAFDRLTNFTVQTLHVATALVSLVDDEAQHFLSCGGKREPWVSLQQTPLSHSLCQYVVADVTPLVINDIRQHPTLHDHPSAREQGIVCYAGVPLCTPDGHAVGALCAVDYQPRDWSEEDLRTLHDLAAMTMTELALRHRLVAEQRSAAIQQVRYYTVVEHLGQGLLIADRQGRITYANPRMGALLGRPPGSLVGRALQHWCDGTAPDWSARGWLAGWDTESSQTISLTDAAGEQRLLTVHATLLHDDQGQVIGTVALFTDITEERRAQEALRLSESTLRLLLEQLPLCLWTTDAELRFRSISGEGYKALGIEPSQYVGQLLNDIFANTPDHPALLAHQRALEGVRTSYDHQARGRQFEVWVTPFRDAAGTITGCLATAIDRTERAQLWQQLQDSRLRLRALSIQLLQAQETERRTIAHELHDEIGQALTAAHLYLQTVLASATSKQQPPLLHCLEQIEHVLSQVRNLSLSLRPALLDDAGLPAAVRWYVDRQASSAGVQAEVQVQDWPERLPSEIETACFRIVQEAMTNLLRHAHAHQVWVRLEWTADAVQIDIRDDGVGFNVPTARARARAGNSLGLLGMEERVHLLGGLLTISSTQGCGTSISASIPLTRRAPPRKHHNEQPTSSARG